MPCDDKITQYIDQTLLDFVENYFIAYCQSTSIFHYTFVMISHSSYVKIYCLRDYFMLIIVQSTHQWPTTA